MFRCKGRNRSVGRSHRPEAYSPRPRPSIPVPGRGGPAPRAGKAGKMVAPAPAPAHNRFQTERHDPVRRSISMKRLFPALYVVLALLAVTPVAVRVLTWRSRPHQPLDSDMA